MPAPDLRVLALVLLTVGCAPTVTTTPQPNMDPGRIITPPPPPPPRLPEPKRPVLPPSEAYGRGLMPLASTNVWAYRQANPTYDGRGVLIGVLDSGIDAAVPGLGFTSTGDRKLLDLRDFSGEGRVTLAPVVPRGDSAVVAGVRLTGLQRVATVGAGPLFGGAIRERILGEMPAADLNGDGDDEDLMAVVVAKASDGWVLFADTDGDGSLASERPIHDYLVARETFGWTVAGRPSPLAVAVNFGPGDPPTLDLFFDTSGHGTHVAGIAAGYGLYGVKGFDGAAPGAQLLGLKIANNAFGGISVTGSMLRAIDYAIRFARDRQLPLVLNMSFGVGNEREGAARIDALVDSVLLANPELVFVTSAGNDGPGLSTMGFPGSAARVISVGATIPPAFTGATDGDVIAFFSSRGGETAKPDILAPGIAYSSVPRWDTGSEDKNGTSMASPQVAGAMALLLSGLRQEKRGWTAAQVRQAVLASGRSLGPSLRADQGAGLLDLMAADRVLRRLPEMAVVEVAVGGVAGGAVFRVLDQGRAADTTITVEVSGSIGGPLRLSSNAGWLGAPASVQLSPPRTRFPLTIKGSSVKGAGIVAGTVTGWATDTTIGPLFRVPVTVVSPFDVPDSGLVVRSTLTSAGVQRVFFAADTARPFRVSVATTSKDAEVLSFLHEPGGQPYREESARRGGFGEEAATYDLDARELVSGHYEVVTVAPPTAGASIEVGVQRSPVSLRMIRSAKDTVTATATNVTATAVAGTAMFGLVGGERTMAFSQRGSAERRVRVTVPNWAARLVVDLTLPRAVWPLFTDFGLAVLDAEGRVLSKDPMNYAFGRTVVGLDSTLAGREVEIVLMPGLADPSASPLWDGDLSIRFYAEAPTLVETAARSEFTLAPGAAVSLRYPIGRLPWTLGDGFFPIGHFVIETGTGLWGRESGLSEPRPPLMR